MVIIKAVSCTRANAVNSSVSSLEALVDSGVVLTGFNNQHEGCLWCEYCFGTKLNIDH